jgi:two-component system CAI-1 autoinducer sensor kinase/phosphatase CqsS
MPLLVRFIDRIRKTAIEIGNYAEPNSTAIGVVGVLGPALTYVMVHLFEPPKYEGLIIYLIGMLIALPQVFYRFIPQKLKQYYPLYVFIGGTYALQFDTFYMLLKNQGGEVWYLCVLGSGMFMIILIYDWLVIMLMMVIAYSIALLLYVLTEGFVWSGEIRPVYIVILLICYIGGIFLNHRKQSSQQDKITLMKSLSGTIAHEMRNPLNAITLAMENIQATLPSRPTGQSIRSANYLLSHEDLLSIHNVIIESIGAVNSGNRMIDSILSNLREGEVDKKYFRRYSITRVIQTALETYSYKNPDDRKLIFTDMGAAFDFFGDREQLIYVLFNLINNALYYSQKPGFRIDISTASGETGNIVRVRDNGPGIPTEYRNQLFTRFFSMGKLGGNGLGLSFCKRVVESFSGTITCDSVEGLWTEFTVTLPEYDSRPVKSIKQQILTTKRILVVDDQAVNRILHAKYLGDFNCLIDLAANGWECLSLAAVNRYDMILMDIEMPMLSGDETVRLLRSGFNMSASMMLHYRDAVIVGVTALPKGEAIRRTLHVGMNEFLLKPLNREVVLGLFEKYFFNEQSVARATIETSLIGARIIVADDNVMVRKILSTILENEGCLVSQAEQGQQVLDLLEKGEFDLLLIDMEMPVMSGMEAVDIIRNDVRFIRYGDLPIIAVTGNTDPETIRQVTKGGMNAHIGKPVLKRDLITTLSFWLGYSRNKAAFPVESGTGSPMKSVTMDGLKDSLVEEIDPNTVDSLLNIGGKAMLLQFYEHFRQDADRQLALLEAAGINRDLPAAFQACHAIKGAASSIGAARLSAMVREIDERLRQGQWPEDAAWFERLRVLYEKSCRSLQAYMIHLEELPR